MACTNCLPTLEFPANASPCPTYSQTGPLHQVIINTTHNRLLASGDIICVTNAVFTNTHCARVRPIQSTSWALCVTMTPNSYIQGKAEYSTDGGVTWAFYGGFGASSTGEPTDIIVQAGSGADATNLPITIAPAGDPTNQIQIGLRLNITTVRGVVGVNDATTTSRIWAIPVSF